MVIRSVTLMNARIAPVLIRNIQNNVDFVNTLYNKLQILKLHSFIAKEQTNFIDKKKIST